MRGLPFGHAVEASLLSPATNPRNLEEVAGDTGERRLDSHERGPRIVKDS